MHLKTKELRNEFLSFYDSALRCVGIPKCGPILTGFRLTNGVSFQTSTEAQQRERDVSKRLLKVLGPVAGHHTNIGNLLWQSVAKQVGGGKDASPEAAYDWFVEELQRNTSLEVDIVKSCHSVALLEKTNNITIGPVRIRRSASCLSELRRRCKGATLFTGEGPSISTEGLDVTLPPFVWQIRLSADKKVHDEQAAWLVDIALTLLRFGVGFDHLGVHPPRLGDEESAPFTKPVSNYDKMTIGVPEGCGFGGGQLEHFYQLGIMAQRRLNRVSFKEKAELVFSPPKKSLAERYAQGAGWLSRGRQAKDRATRLLYFFTAIEALLSTNDKNAPVTQTIARHLAVLLTDDNVQREKAAKTLRDLYGLRSSLVHSGERGVHDQDANQAQYYAENLFGIVWLNADFKQVHSDFCSALAKASYGMPFHFNGTF